MTKKNKLTVYETKLVVEGSGCFPYDMLRYDHCTPFSESDSSGLEYHTPGMRKVTLRRRCVSPMPATEGRWKSFGWRIVSEESTW